MTLPVFIVIDFQICLYSFLFLCTTNAFAVFIILSFHILYHDLGCNAVFRTSLAVA